MTESYRPSAYIYKNYKVNRTHFEIHYLERFTCLWCGKQEYRKSSQPENEKQIVRQGKQINAIYKLQYCSDKCMHEDPLSKSRINHFIYNCENWRQQYIDIKKEEENEAIKYSKNLEKERRERLEFERISRKRKIIFRSIIIVVICIYFYNSDFSIGEFNNEKTSTTQKSTINNINDNAGVQPNNKKAFCEYEYKDLSKLGLDEIKRRLGELWNKQQSHGQLIPDGKRDIENLKISYDICLEVINYMSERTLRGAPSNDLGACLQSFTWSYQVNSSAREIENWINSFSKSYAFEDSDKEINLKFWRNAISQITSEFNQYSDEELFTWFIDSGKY